MNHEKLSFPSVDIGQVSLLCMPITTALYMLLQPRHVDLPARQWTGKHRKCTTKRYVDRRNGGEC